MSILGAFSSLLGLLTLILIIVKVVALVDASLRPQEAFPAAGKQTKGFWLILLGVLVMADLVGLGGGLFGLLGIAGLIAAIVYFVDVRPAVRELGRGGRGGSSGTHMGPYGPW